MTMKDFPPDVFDALSAAGWSSGRRDHETMARLERARVPVEHPAFAALAEFGALALGDTGAGEQCARCNVQFDLIAARDESAVRWAALLHTQLVGIGWTHNNHGELYMSEDGRVFENSVVHDAFCFLGANLSEALTRLLRGQKARPMLRPDQAEVRLYGDAFTAADPNLYQWQD
jgi:hypothetical protein